jgi:hypothetical protein
MFFAASFILHSEHSDAQLWYTKDTQNSESPLQVCVIFFSVLRVPKFMFKLMGGQKFPSKCTDNF